VYFLFIIIQIIKELIEIDVRSELSNFRDGWRPTHHSARWRM